MKGIQALIGALQRNYDKLCCIVSNTATASAAPNVLDISNDSGSTLNTWKSFTFVCVAGTIDIGTETFPPGTYTFSNGKGLLDSIAYDATGSADCKIIYVI